jgi:hypothetical protein
MRRYPNHQRILAILIAASLGTIAADRAQAADTAAFWKDRTATNLTAKTPTTVAPARYRAVVLDLGALKTELGAAAASIRQGRGNNLALPLPEGGVTYFTLSESNVLPAALASRYPQLKSYKGVDEKGRHVRLDITPYGLQAMVYGDDGGAWIVQPALQLSGKAIRASDRGDEYWSFRRADLSASAPFNEQGYPSGMLNRSAMRPYVAASKTPGSRAGGSVMYDYRLAMAATSTYTESFGGTVADGLAAIATMVNRLNEVYENDLGVHFTLIADADKIIYTAPANDPYAELEPGGEGINEENVTNLAQVIGNANFDVGHVVAGDGGGGMAWIASTCDDEVKAYGSTGRTNPVGDAFAVDFVAHELGHSFGSYHTHNAQQSTLPDKAVEPGEGSTVMGYAGVIGGVFSYQPHSDPYFNGSSIDSIQDWMAGAGGVCAKRKLNLGAAPWIAPESLLPPDIFSSSAGRSRYTLPARTPFALTAAVTSNNASKLTYTWEQFDFGPAQAGKLKDDGRSPIFRSFKPHASIEQTFPSLAAVLGNEPLGNGQVYPATTRQLSFHLTVRDNALRSGTANTGPHTATGNIYLNVLDTGSAFAVTAPRTAVTWKSGSEQTVTWNVAKTDKAPIACPKVDVGLSLDGGYTWGTAALARVVPNTGSAKIKLPANTVSTKARIRVSCSNNVFFAVSPVNLNLSR